MRYYHLFFLFILSHLLSGCFEDGSSSSSSGSGVCDSAAVASGSCPGVYDPDANDGPTFSLVTSNISGTQKLPTDGTINLSFSTNIASYSVVTNSSLPNQEDTFTLRDGRTDEEILVSSTVNNNQVQISPRLPLESGRIYYLDIGDGLEGVNGTVLDENQTIIFQAEEGGPGTSAGESVFSWTQEHEPSRPVSHYILYYDANEELIRSDSGELIKENEMLIVPDGLSPDLEGQRSYHMTFDNEELPGVVPGVYNYFMMKACNEEYCSAPSNQAEKYFD